MDQTENGLSILLDNVSTCSANIQKITIILRSYRGYCKRPSGEFRKLLRIQLFGKAYVRLLWQNSDIVSIKSARSL